MLYSQATQSKLDSFLNSKHFIPEIEENNKPLVERLDDSDRGLGEAKVRFILKAIYSKKLLFLKS